MPPFRDLNPRNFHIVRREDWGAVKPKFTANMWFPLSYVVTSYTKYTKGCVFPDNCSKELLFTQHLHMKNCPDIKYNFLISESGEVFEGRGWLAKPSLPGVYRDIQYTSLYIGYIGSFKDSLPNEDMVEAKEALIKHGIKMDLIQKKVLEFDLEGASLIEKDSLRLRYE